MLPMGLLSDSAKGLGHRAWPPRGWCFSQEHTEHNSSCAAKASVFCSCHGASSVSAGCPRGVEKVVSENPSRLLEPTQRTHSSAGTSAGLGQAQRHCQENDSISADAVLAGEGLWRIAYKKPQNSLKGIYVGGEKEKGIWALLESSVLCVPSFVGCLCSSRALSYFPLLNRAVKHGRGGLVWQAYKSVTCVLVYIVF